MSQSLMEDLNDLRDLLRKACKAWGKDMPQEVTDWWVGEQGVIQSEKAAHDAVVAAKRIELQQRIDELTDKLAQLV